jgi:hypothetical protein
MTELTPLPPELPPTGFLASAAATAGVRPSRLRARGLEKSIWGVRSESPIEDHLDRARLLLLRMPSAFLSHSSAARLWGVPLPPFLHDGGSVELAVHGPERAPHARGVHGHSRTIDPADVVEHRALRTTSASRTWFDLGSRLRAPDLVAAGDALLRAGTVIASDLAELVETHPGARGIKQLRVALPLLDPRAESPQESRMRAILAINGLGGAVPNHTLIGSDRRFVARLDLAFIDERVAIEYQGDYHRERDQWRSDMTRRLRIEAEGWQVIEIGPEQLATPNDFLIQVRQALQARRR